MTNNKAYAPYNMYAPDGTVYQLNYAKSATELGNTTVALTNGEVGVLMVHKPKPYKYACDSLYKVTELKNGLFAFSGITNDGIKYISYLKEKELIENITKDREIHPLYVFDDLSYEMARNAISGNRLYGAAGILMCEFEGKIRVTELQPNSKAIEVFGTAVGARNQSSKTILATNLERFKMSTENELVEICHLALKNAHPDAKVELVGDEVECYLLKVGEKAKKIEIN